ncbi:hypothetical protein DMENIID0001_094970 [Sergentomyia squamirostris]
MAAKVVIDVEKNTVKGSSGGDDRCSSERVGTVVGSRIRGPLEKSWFQCPRRARDLVLDRFVTFKQPVDSHPEKENVAVEDVFTSSMLIESVIVRGRSLGAWIDLTTRKGYYDPQAVRDVGARYISMPCEESYGPPSALMVRLFLKHVDKCIESNPEDVIGVHCFHGFNRSGFMVVAYMIERLDYSVEKALAVFADIHPPGIYKQAYVQELFFRYDNPCRSSGPVALAPWHFQSAPTDRKRQYLSRLGGSVAIKRSREVLDYTPIDSPSGPPAKKSKFDLSVAPVGENFAGFKLLQDAAEVKRLRQICQSMCKVEHLEFPGVQPSLMDSGGLDYLQIQPYCVSWLADGTRFMMLILGENQVYAFDRSNTCFHVEGIRFPQRNDLQGHLKNTLVDGQFVFDRVGLKLYPRFLIFDIIHINGQNVSKQSFLPVRSDCILQEIIRPREEAFKQGLLDKATEPFSVRQKSFYELSHAESLLSPSFTKQLGHKSRGLVFQSTLDPYTPGTSPSCLRWKPKHKISVDFRLQICTEGSNSRKKIGLLWLEDSDAPVGMISSVSTLEHCHNKVVECLYVDGQWNASRLRPEKVTEDSFRVYLSVWSSLRNCVDSQSLCAFIKDDC